MAAPDTWEEATDPPPAESSRINYLDESPGPWFIAAYTSACSGCGGDIDNGDEIRADGTGGYECRECGDERDKEDTEL